MSKEGSEVAFIPENISNISSGKEKFKEDNTQKIEDSYISKLTKLQNFQNVTNNVQIKSQTQQIFQTRDATHPNQIVEVIAKKLIELNTQVESVNPSSQKYISQKFSLQKDTKQLIGKISRSQEIKHSSYHESDNTYLQVKHTQTDVISEKESFVEEEHEIEAKQSCKQREENFVHFDSVQEEKKNSQQNSSIVIKDSIEDLKDTFHVTYVNKYDEFGTEIGWLQHCVGGNVKHLLRQANQLLDYNNALMIEIQKVQLRKKIIELQIQTNKLKIALRKSPCSKHINFSVDLKMKRPTVLKIPKKIDVDMRKYCIQLQKKVEQLRNVYENNEKELKLLEFYEKQFEKKVTYTYIYQEYLMKKSKQELKISKDSPRKNDSKGKNIRNSSKSLNQDSQHEFNQSTTSLANRLKSKQGNMNFKRILKNNVISQKNDQKDGKNKLLTMNRSTQTLIQTTSNQQYTEFLNNSKHRNPALSSPKRISLVHYKNLILPSNQKQISLSNNSSQKYFFRLFNTPNRSKKNFYYQCQMYLKEIQKNYLGECEQENTKIFLNNGNGFRERELLKMKALQIKNQILDTEVDIVTKEKQINKQNQILKRELKILENELLTKYSGQNQLENSKKLKEIAKNPQKNINLFPNDYNILYKQAKHQLQSYKSATMLENVRPNIPKSPKKVSNQQSLEKITFGRNKTQSKTNVSQNSESRNFNNDAKYEGRKMSKSPILVKLRKSSQKTKKFLCRFKTTLSQDFLNQTIEENNLKKSNKSKPQKTTMNQQMDNVNFSNPQVKLIQKEYYAI